MDDFREFENIIPDDAPEWYINLAAEVDRLMRAPEVRERFAEMYLAWRSIHSARVADAARFDERRDEHFKKWLSAHPECLCPEDGVFGEVDCAESPDENWLREVDRVRFHSKDADGNLISDETGRLVRAWVPPELAIDKRPDDSLPLPRSGRRLLLEEQYVLLWAIHNFCLPERSVEPPQTAERAHTDAGCPEGDLPEGWLHTELVQRACQLPRAEGEKHRYRTFLEDDLQDVRRDLKAQPGKPEGAETGDGGHESWPASNSWHFRPGEAAFAGVRIIVKDIPWSLLQILAEARMPLTARGIADAFCTDPAGTSVEESTIRGYLSNLRKILRKTFDLGESNPIPSVTGRPHSAWKLDNEALRRAAQKTR